MSTEDQARFRMLRNHHNVKNRQQSMLSRTAEEIGLESSDYWTTIQGKPKSSFRQLYDRSGGSMS